MEKTMKGIVLISHGPMAKGLYETTQWFFGKDINQYEYLCLQEDDQQADFIKKIKDKILKTDSGEGVIVFIDLLGGTPCNSCIDLMSDSIQLITGMNLTIVLELLGNRLSGSYNIDELIATGKRGLVHVNNYTLDSDDDFID